MKIFVALAIVLTTLLAIAAEPNRVDTGKVIRVSSDGLTLDQGPAGTVLIGFVVDDAVVGSLERIKTGDEVRAVFGSTKGPNGNSINKLLSIRICTKNDRECAADHRKQKNQALEDERKRAISEKKRDLCRNSMQKTLSSDSRYTPSESVTVSENYLAQYKALEGTARTCASNQLKQHEIAVLEACLLHHCGDNIGGGCWHIARYSMNSAAIQNAVNTWSRL